MFIIDVHQFLAATGIEDMLTKVRKTVVGLIPVSMFRKLIHCMAEKLPKTKSIPREVYTCFLTGVVDLEVNRQTVVIVPFQLV